MPLDRGVGTPKSLLDSMRVQSNRDPVYDRDLRSEVGFILLRTFAAILIMTTQPKKGHFLNVHTMTRKQMVAL